MFERMPQAATDAGIPWYKRRDYARILEVMEDSDRLPTTFDKWQGRAEKAERQLRREGRTPHRVHIDPDKFVAWCAATGRNVDANGRAHFAADPAN